MEKLLKDLKTKHFQNMTHFKDTSVYFKDFNDFEDSNGQCSPDSYRESMDDAAYLDLPSRPGHDDDDFEDSIILLMNLISRISRSGKFNIVMIDELCISALFRSSQLNLYVQDLKNERSQSEKPFLLDLELPSIPPNLRLILSLSPSLNIKEPIQRNIPFELYLPETTSQKYSQLVARYRNTGGILSFVNFVAKEQVRIGGNYCELSKKLDQSIASEDLPAPLTFSEKNKNLNDCKPVIWIKDFSIAEPIMDELFNSEEMADLTAKSEKPIIFLHPYEDHFTDEEKLVLDQLKVTKLQLWTFTLHIAQASIDCFK